MPLLSFAGFPDLFELPLHVVIIGLLASSGVFVAAWVVDDLRKKAWQRLRANRRKP